MEHSVLKESSVFKGLPEDALREALDSTPHQIHHYDRDETVFHMMDPADMIGIILEGRVQAQKSFPNGSQVNVSLRGPGELIGAAAAFSKGRKYPCDIVAAGPASVMMFLREDLIGLMQKQIRILENILSEIASAAYMLQERVELLSYSGIAQKAAFWLLIHQKRSGSSKVVIPGSVSRWAMIMNVSRTSLHRELKNLEAAHVISYSPPLIEIKDRQALNDILNR